MSTNNAEYLIEVNSLTMTFDKETVIKDLSCKFERGLIHGIVGNNGSGKTVLMKCICGFLNPTEGYVLVDGKRIGKDTDFPDELGMIIEAPGFLPGLSGIKNLKILADLNGRIKKEQIEEAIRTVGLDPKMKKPVGKYSLGMRQRLGIAQAIMEKPKLLMLDEPFNGLDKNGVREMRDLIKSLRSDGRTILLSSHNQVDIDELCDTVREMDAGVMTRIK